MTEQQKKYSCTHSNSRAGECPICVNMYNEMEAWSKNQLAHIANMRSDMKSAGFKHARDYLNHLALKES